MSFTFSETSLNPTKIIQTEFFFPQNIHIKPQNQNKQQKTYKKKSYLEVNESGFNGKTVKRSHFPPQEALLTEGMERTEVVRCQAM